MFFFFKQKTAYEIGQWLEFRRVLFRSKKKTSNINSENTLFTGYFNFFFFVIYLNETIYLPSVNLWNLWTISFNVHSFKSQNGISIKMKGLSSSKKFGGIMNESSASYKMEFVHATKITLVRQFGILKKDGKNMKIQVEIQNLQIIWGIILNINLIGLW